MFGVGESCQPFCFMPKVESDFDGIKYGDTNF